MGITSSLYSGISGLNTNGTAMNVIGDNISNVNTIGFKASRTTFQDVLSQSIATASGTDQIGRGTAMSSVDTLFQQGSFESTTSATDLAIGGAGYFILRQNGTDTDFYSRAGQFSFDQDGNFVNPAGYIVQGWQLDRNGNDVGTIGDVRLTDFTSPPEATAAVTSITNLDSTAESLSASLFGAWAADTDPLAPIGDTSYAYQTSVRIYDSLGNSHDLTVYFDKCGGTTASEYDAGLTDVQNSWEYIVTCNPNDDMRAAFASAESKGVLMRGTLGYDQSTGGLTGMSAYVYDGAGDPDVSSNWTQSTFSAEGYPQFDAEFVGPGVVQTVALKQGLRNSDYATGTGWGTGSTTVSAITALNGVPNFIAEEPQATISTQYSSSSTTVYQSQNGYGTGFLESLSVDTDGVLTGQYSNGQIIYLNRVALAKFNNEQGLDKIGGNLWSSTRASGPALTDHPGLNGLGSISPNSLEQSNVDLASEFVRMITTQRGFQANSRIISTVDSMLQELINIVR
jgi:flagellar hook protein FlgE